jgi:zinc protease
MRKLLLLLVIVAVALGVLLFQSSIDVPEPLDSGAPVALDASDGVQSFQLENGMKVLVIENKRAPVVVSQVWYKVGGSYEYDGITGVSHVLEHMMFKGTPKHPAGEFSEIIAANGGKENAFTSKDYTAFFQRIANDRLELCLEMEADRMRNLSLDEAEFLKELEVVKEERRLRTDDVPTALTFERFNALAYANSPYRQPIIGWMEDLDSMTINDARDWYRTWYAPNNATLVVAGDVNATEVVELANKYFGPLKTSVIPEVKPRREAAQYGTQRVTVKLPAKVPYLIMGYKVPVLSTAAEADAWEVYALEVLSGLLDGGSSARLQKNLVRGSELATSVGASYDLYALHDSSFILSAVPSNDIPTDRIESALKAEIRAVQQEPPTRQELDRVIAQVIASKVYEQDSNFYLAMQIGSLETTGLGWQTKQAYVDRVQSVTPEQIQQVAQKYFVDEGLTVAVLDPLPLTEKTVASTTATGGSHVH